MKFKNCIIKKLNGRTDEQAQSNVLVQLFQSWVHKNKHVEQFSVQNINLLHPNMYELLAL